MLLVKHQYLPHKGAVGLFLAGLLIPIFFTGGLAAKEGARTKVISRGDQLPVGVRHMHQAILQAARSGKIERLREVLEMNELKPLINGRFIGDPVKHWQNTSRVHKGVQILALLTEILELPPVQQTTKYGSLYIWPYFAEQSLNKLSAPALIGLYRLVPVANIPSMLKNNRYTYAKIILGGDGTWHGFDYDLGALGGQ